MSAPSPPEPRRVLFLTPFPPRLDADHGGARTVANLVTELPAPTRVAVLALRAESEPPTDTAVRDRCELVEDIPRARLTRSPARLWAERRRLVIAARSGSPWAAGTCEAELVQRLRQVVETWKPHVVQAEFVVMGQYFGVLHPPAPARVLVEHDPRATGAPTSWRRRWLWSRFRRRVYRAADAVVTFTERDRLDVARLAPGAHVVRIPVATRIPSVSVVQEDELPTILFFGNFAHLPNVDAARRLVTSILPAIRLEHPHAVLELVGPNPPSGLDGVGVRVTGLVPDVRPFLERSWVVAAPLDTGGGMRVKVLETLAAGKALVASPLALEGVGAEEGVHYVRADEDSEFAARIGELLADRDERRRLGLEARKWAAANVSWSRTAQRYDELHASLAREQR